MIFLSKEVTFRLFLPFIFLCNFPPSGTASERCGISLWRGELFPAPGTQQPKVWIFRSGGWEESIKSWLLTLYFFTDFGTIIFVANFGRFLFEFEKWGGTQVFVVSLPEIVFLVFPILYFWEEEHMDSSSWQIPHQNDQTLFNSRLTKFDEEQWEMIYPQWFATTCSDKPRHWTLLKFHVGFTPPPSHHQNYHIFRLGTPNLNLHAGWGKDPSVMKPRVPWPERSDCCHSSCWITGGKWLNMEKWRNWITMKRPRKWEKA